jgi:hypothetical protein
VEPAGAFIATINWGDGTTSTGTISLSGSTYRVTGSHTYATSGAHTVTTTVTESGTAPDVAFSGGSGGRSRINASDPSRQLADQWAIALFNALVHGNLSTNGQAGLLASLLASPPQLVSVGTTFLSLGKPIGSPASTLDAALRMLAGEHRDSAVTDIFFRLLSEAGTLLEPRQVYSFWPGDGDPNPPDRDGR